MLSQWLPARDYHADLTNVRLVAFATVLRDVWKRVSELHEPDAGDDMWSLSCRAFKRCTFHLKRRSQTDWHWLTVDEPRPMQLVLSVGVIPARFYHGDSLEDMPLRYSQSPTAEKVARQGLLNLSDGSMKGLVRFVTKTDAKGVPLRVTLVEYDEETRVIINRFDIPEADAGAPTGVVAFPTPQLKPGVTQASPAPRPRDGRVKQQGDDVE